jgi:hypothetical protein
MNSEGTPVTELGLNNRSTKWCMCSHVEIERYVGVAEAAAITLFDGQDALGGLCRACAAAGPRVVAEQLLEQAAEWRDLAVAPEEQHAALLDLAEQQERAGEAVWTNIRWERAVTGEMGMRVTREPSEGRCLAAARLEVEERKRNVEGYRKRAADLEALAVRIAHLDPARWPSLEDDDDDDVHDEDQKEVPTAISPEEAQAGLDELERLGLVKRNGKFRDGCPVYVAIKDE